MKVAISGSSGLIGSALTKSLEADGHQVLAITRSAAGSDSVRWDPTGESIDAAGLEGCDAVVHLAGEPIAAGPWTDKQRAKIHDSREKGTKLLAGALASMKSPPKVLVSGSAIGFYGDRGDEVLTETSAVGDGFLADVCRAWEAATERAEGAGIRVVHIRTGIVLDSNGGALAKQIPLYKAFLGGKAGKGNQWLSWISLRDEVAAIRFAIDSESLNGPVNLTAPEPVTNARFTKALGSALGRPTFMTVPRLVEHLPFGIGDLLGNLLFASDRVQPVALTDAGFEFADRSIDSALDSVLD